MPHSLLALIGSNVAPLCRVLAIAIDACAGCVVSASRRGEGAASSTSSTSKRGDGGAATTTSSCIDVPYLSRLACVVTELSLYPALFNQVEVWTAAASQVEVGSSYPLWCRPDFNFVRDGGGVTELYSQLLLRCGDMRVCAHKALHASLFRAALQLSAHLPRRVSAPTLIDLLHPLVVWRPQQQLQLGAEGPAAAQLQLASLPPLLTGSVSTAVGLLHCLTSAEWNVSEVEVRPAATGTSTLGTRWAPADIAPFLLRLQVAFFDDPNVRSRLPAVLGHAGTSPSCCRSSPAGASEGGGNAAALTPTTATSTAPASVSASSGSSPLASAAASASSAAAATTVAAPKQSAGALSEIVSYLVELTKTEGGGFMCEGMALASKLQLQMVTSATVAEPQLASGAHATVGTEVVEIVTATLEGMWRAQGSSSGSSSSTRAQVPPFSSTPTQASSAKLNIGDPRHREQLASVRPQPPSRPYAVAADTLPTMTQVEVAPGSTSTSTSTASAIAELEALFAPLAAPGLISTGPAIRSAAERVLALGLTHCTLSPQVVVGPGDPPLQVEVDPLSDAFTAAVESRLSALPLPRQTAMRSCLSGLFSLKQQSAAGIDKRLLPLFLLTKSAAYRLAAAATAPAVPKTVATSSLTVKNPASVQPAAVAAAVAAGSAPALAATAAGTTVAATAVLSAATTAVSIANTGAAATISSGPSTSTSDALPGPLHIKNNNNSSSNSSVCGGGSGSVTGAGSVTGSDYTRRVSAGVGPRPAVSTSTSGGSAVRGAQQVLQLQPVPRKG